MDGDLHDMYVIERSSGVSGGCYYWPRLPEQDRNLVPQVDMGFRMFYGIDRTPDAAHRARSRWARGSAA